MINVYTNKPSSLGTMLVNVFIKSPPCDLVLELTLFMIFWPLTFSSCSPPWSSRWPCCLANALCAASSNNGLCGGVLFVKTFAFCMVNQRSICALSRSDNTPPPVVGLLLASFDWLGSWCFFFPSGPFSFTWCLRFRLWCPLFCIVVVLTTSAACFAE